MAVIEKDGLYQYIDENGNIYILYPVTKLENVTGAGKLIQSPDGKTLATLDGTNIAFVKPSDIERFATTKALDSLAEQVEETEKALDDLDASANAASRVEFVNNVLKTIGGTIIDMGNAKIVTGTYQGTGTVSTTANPVSITLSIVPRVVFVFGSTDNSPNRSAQFGAMISGQIHGAAFSARLYDVESSASSISVADGSSGAFLPNVTFSEKNVSWGKTTRSDLGGAAIFNGYNRTYSYVAIG